MAWNAFLGGLVVLSISCPTSLAQVTERVSVSTPGVQGNWDSHGGALSADGRYAAFRSMADTLVPGDANVHTDVFVRDRATATTSLASVTASGSQLDTSCGTPSISDNGRFVASTAFVPDLVFPFQDHTRLYLKDRETGTLTLIAEKNGYNGGTSISGDNRYVAFAVSGSLYVYDRLAGALALEAFGSGPQFSTDGRYLVFITGQVFVRDRVAGTTECVSLNWDGNPATGTSTWASISADGRWVAFHSTAPDLVAGDENFIQDVFVCDRPSGTITCISRGPEGQAGDAASSRPHISADGRFVAFSSKASNLVPVDGNGTWDTFVHDRSTGTTALVSVDSTGGESNGTSGADDLSANGSVIGFTGLASDLVPGDTNNTYDVFVRDLAPGCPGTVSYCAASPNSSGAPAMISSTGWAGFSADNWELVCTALPAATNGLFFFGTSAIDPGVPFGNGVRCVGGALTRLGVVSAQGGNASQAQDLSSAAYAGFVPGDVRHFEFWFRDVAAGGAVFNASDALTVTFCN